MVNTGVRQAREKGHAHEASIQGSGATAGATGDAPAGGTLPETIVSGIARLNGPSGCVKQAFRAGSAVATKNATASMLRRQAGQAVHRYACGLLDQGPAGAVRLRPPQGVARVTFVEGSGTQARALPLTFRRCAQGAVAPRFTG